MKRFLFLATFIVFAHSLFAQNNDSLHLPRQPREPSIFSNTDTITRNDYLLTIEKVFQVLNKTSVLSQPVPTILEISDDLSEDDSAINIIRDRINRNDRTLNIRNLQMFSIILTQINNSSQGYSQRLNNYDSLFKALKFEVIGLRKDTLLRQILKDSALRVSFSAQLLQLRPKFKKADSLLKYVHLLIGNTQVQASDNSILTNVFLSY